MFLYNLAAIVKQETDKRISSDFSLNFKKHTYQVSLSFTLNKKYDFSTVEIRNRLYGSNNI